MKRLLLFAASMAAAMALADEVVKASSFGWNPTNATKCLQAALDSGANKVLVDRQPSEWLVDTVFPRSNTEIVFEDGDGVYLLKARHVLVENLCCTGHARNGASVISADDVVVRNCTFAYAGGTLPECGMDIEPIPAKLAAGEMWYNLQPTGETE